MQGFFEKQALISVAKDEKYLNLLKKLIETRDDKEDGTVIGIEDGTVNVVAWDEKTWLAQKKMGQITSKILLIGNIKDSEKLLPLLNVKFEKYGVKYGWSGRQALIYINPNVFEHNDKFYKEFQEEYNQLDIPEVFKIKVETKPTETKNLKWFEKASKFIVDSSKDIKDAVTFKNNVMDKLTIYGIVLFYNKHLNEFLNA